MKFLDLTKEAKDKVRSWYFDDYDLDHVIEDIKACAACLSVKVERVYYSIGWCQGDYAAYYGFYTPEPGLVDAIKAHAPKDEELHRIAGQLITDMTAARMLSQSFTGIRLSASQHGYQAAYAVDDNDGDYEPELSEQALKDFGAWAYRRLRDELEYYWDDAHLAEALGDHYDFDEHGSII